MLWSKNQYFFTSTKNFAMDFDFEDAYLLDFDPDKEALDCLLVYLNFDRWDVNTAVHLIAGIEPPLGTQIPDQEATTNINKSKHALRLRQLYLSRRGAQAEDARSVEQWLTWAQARGVTPPWLRWTKYHWPEFMKKFEPDPVMEDEGNISVWTLLDNADYVYSPDVSTHGEPIFELPECSHCTALRAEIDELRRTCDKQANLLKTPRPRAEATYQHLIGVLLKYIKGDLVGIARHPSFVNDMQMRDCIATEFAHVDGISLSNLNLKLPEAQKAFESAALSGPI